MSTATADELGRTRPRHPAGPPATAAAAPARRWSRRSPATTAPSPRWTWTTSCAGASPRWGAPASTARSSSSSSSACSSRIEVARGVAGYERIEPDGEHHHHAICRDCGRMIPFEDRLAGAGDRQGRRADELRAAEHEVVDPRPLRALRSGVGVPAFEEGQRVDRAASFVPAGAVQISKWRWQAVASPVWPTSPIGWPVKTGVARAQRRGLDQVRVHEVHAGALGVDDEVVAGERLVAGILDRAAAGGDDRGAAPGHHVLALVAVPGAAGAEAAAGAAEVVRPEQREGVAVEREPEAGGAGGGRRAAEGSAAPRGRPPGARSGRRSGRSAPRGHQRRSRPRRRSRASAGRRRCGSSS